MANGGMLAYELKPSGTPSKVIERFPNSGCPIENS
jgi:hypothetical protein